VGICTINRQEAKKVVRAVNTSSQSNFHKGMCLSFFLPFFPSLFFSFSPRIRKMSWQQKAVSRSEAKEKLKLSRGRRTLLVAGCWDCFCGRHASAPRKELRIRLVLVVVLLEFHEWCSVCVCVATVFVEMVGLRSLGFFFFVGFVSEFSQCEHSIILAHWSPWWVFLFLLLWLRIGALCRDLSWLLFPAYY